jgi:exosortase E/protease (VPEID-CTERM system)
VKLFSSIIYPSATCRSPVPFPFIRSACVVALLAVEALVVSLRFDGESVDVDRVLYRLGLHSGTVTRLGIAVGLATMLVASPRVFRALKRLSDRDKAPPWFLRWLACNLLSFLSFYRLSALVLEGHRSQSFEWILVVSWGTTGVATFVFCALASLPADVWASLLRQSGLCLVVGPALGTIAFLSGLLAQDQWKVLSQATLQLVAAILSIVFSSVVCQPQISVVGTTSFTVEIAPACSGYEGLGMLATFLCIALWLFRRDLRFPRSLILLPVGMVLIWLSNAFRIAALVALGTWGYPDLALAGFHSLAGWVLFLLIGLGLIASARRSSFFSTVREREPDTDVRLANLDGAYLVPAMAIIAAAMITTSLSPGFEYYYPARVIAATAALVFYRKSYSELRLTWSWEAFVIGCGVFALWITLEPPGARQSGVGPAHSALESIAPVWAIGWLFFRVVGSVITVPLAEELAFRGYLTRRLITTDFRSIPAGRMTWWSVLISSALFGALHGRWFAGALAGMAYALAYRRRSELTDAVLAHGVTNVLIAITVLSTEAWSLWP